MTNEVRQIKTPQEIAERAFDSLCAFDAVDAPTDYQSTLDRLSEFMTALMQIGAERLVSVAQRPESLEAMKEPDEVNQIERLVPLVTKPPFDEDSDVLVVSEAVEITQADLDAGIVTQAALMGAIEEKVIVVIERLRWDILIRGRRRLQKRPLDQDDKVLAQWELVNDAQAFHTDIDWSALPAGTEIWLNSFTFIELEDILHDLDLVVNIYDGGYLPDDQGRPSYKFIDDGIFIIANGEKLPLGVFNYTVTSDVIEDKSTKQKLAKVTAHVRPCSQQRDDVIVGMVKR